MSWAQTSPPQLGHACKHLLASPYFSPQTSQPCYRAQSRSPSQTRSLPDVLMGRRRNVAASAAPAAEKPQRGLGVLPADHGDSPFRELAVPEIWEGIGKTRVRQHVNPLRREHQIATGAPDWSSTFAHPSAPLVLDLGCGPGRFLLLMHQRRTKGTLCLPCLGSQDQPANYLGLEIRKPLVDRANEWSLRLGFADHVQFVASNATISLLTMLDKYPGPIKLLAIQFPDPHFKRRHYKRRIFQPQMVEHVTQLLAPGGVLLLQSDVLHVAVAMRNIFEKYAGHAFDVSDAHTPDSTFQAAAQPLPTFAAEAAPGTSSAEQDDDFVQAEDLASSDDPQDVQGKDDDYLTLDSQWAARGWLKDNPLSVPTEREHYVMQQGLPVYRLLLVRKDNAATVQA